MSITFGIRPSAAADWLRLHQALADADRPAPCISLPDAWWSNDDELTEQAAHLCGRCPVLAQCDAFATANRETAGIWGGRDRTPTRGRPANLRKESACSA